ncbi:GNAT family N-acetyltransferase [Herbiconiux sp. CPCC 205763]|uniref:GNAT family N-acetyltransferase n=1 Tax=Herbiconiux aconitum TaxID=2970913 RepID=A0ABT2GR28_9MICO|nr:GNAT family N-acetyltransferase [Herbiconiux aconitum]MCS5718643.1 GNAT family N-acetyltransferase [Herbiconiux aconitum]
MPTHPAAPIIRSLTDADVDRLVLLNRRAVPAVNDIGADEMRTLLAQAQLAAAVLDPGHPEPAHPDAVVGFVLALPPGVDYASENYRWFSERAGDDGGFLYVDRIVVAEGHRSAGLGAVLYDAVFAAARESGATEVDCEVNVEPPNPGSLAFHARLGFWEVGRQATKGGAVVVALLAADVSDFRDLP